MTDKPKKPFLKENYAPVDITLKNFKPTPGSETVNPMEKPSFNIGNPVGEKPEPKPTTDVSNESGKGRKT